MLGGGYPELSTHLRRVLRYQKGNQNPYIEEEQTTQWPKEKVQKDKKPSTKHTHKTKDRVTRTPLKTGVELRCSGRVGSSCTTKVISPRALYIYVCVWYRFWLLFCDFIRFRKYSDAVEFCYYYSSSIYPKNKIPFFLHEGSTANILSFVILYIHCFIRSNNKLIKLYTDLRNYYLLLYSYNFNPIKNTHLRHVTVHYFSRILQPEAVFFPYWTSR